MFNEWRKNNSILIIIIDKKFNFNRYFGKNQFSTCKSSSKIFLITESIYIDNFWVANKKKIIQFEHSWLTYQPTTIQINWTKFLFLVKLFYLLQRNEKKYLNWIFFFFFENHCNRSTISLLITLGYQDLFSFFLFPPKNKIFCYRHYYYYYIVKL